MQMTPFDHLTAFYAAMAICTFALGFSRFLYMTAAGEFVSPSNSLALTGVFYTALCVVYLSVFAASAVLWPLTCWWFIREAFR